MTGTSRRFQPPWSVEDVGAAFVVKDSTGDRQMEMGENAAYLLDDARGIAANMIVGSQPRGNKGGG